MGEGWVRALFSFFHVPREGGDPDPFTQTRSGPLAQAFEGGTSARAVDKHPPLPSLSPQGGKGLIRVIACASREPVGLDTPERKGLDPRLRGEHGGGNVEDRFPRFRRYFPLWGKIYRP
jgi:hypothetical protein